MKLEHITIDPQSLGAQIALASDTEQAKFFKGFAAELRTWMPSNAAQLQFCAVERLLSERDKATLKHALTMLWYKEGDE